MLNADAVHQKKSLYKWPLKTNSTYAWTRKQGYDKKLDLAARLLGTLRELLFTQYLGVMYVSVSSTAHVQHHLMS